MDTTGKIVLLVFITFVTLGLTEILARIKK